MNKKKSPGSGMLPGELSFILNRSPFCFEPVIRKDYSSPNFVNVSPKTHRRTVERFACAFP